MREAKRQLDARAYLKKQWSSGGLHQEYLHQMMFHHAAVTGKHDHVVCWGRQEPLAEPGMAEEMTVMELARPDSPWEDIADLYCDVYQLRKLPGRMLCDEEMEAHIHQEILDSVKECLWCKQLSTQPAEELRQSPASIPRINPQAYFQARNCTTYNRFMDVRWDSCEEVLAIARDAHQRTLVAMALLEDKIERISCSLSHSHWYSGSHRCLGSCQWRRSQTADHQSPPGGIIPWGPWRWDQSPSLSQLREWVTFTPLSSRSSPKRDTDVQEPHLLTWRDEGRPDDQSDWSRLNKDDLECPPPLEPHIKDFLQEEMLPANAGSGDNFPWASMPEPSPMEGMEWIKWHMWQLDMLAWWQELNEVPSQDDLQEFTRRV